MVLSYDLAWGRQIPGGDPKFLFPISIRAQWPDQREVELLWHKGNESFVTSRFAQALEGAHAIQPINNHPNSFIGRFEQNYTHLGDEYGILSILGDWTRRLTYVASHRSIKNIGQLNAPLDHLDGDSLPGHLSMMRTNEEQQYEDFQNQLCRLIPSVRRVFAYNEGSGGVSIRVSGQMTATSSSAHRLDTVGGGVTEMLYLIANIWLSPRDSVVLIEEPERGLHATTQRVLLTAARAHAADYGKQLIWATHSTIMAPLQQDCSTYLVTLPGEEGTNVTKVGKESADLIRQTLGHWNADLYNYDLLVLVDGETEEAVLPDLAEWVLGADKFRAMHFRAYRGDLASRREAIAHLITLLSGSATSIFIFGDDDKGARQAVADLVKQFSSQGFTSDNVHLWSCGLDADGARGAEFEDNFALDELVDAANTLGGSALMTAGDLETRVKGSISTAVSKVLERYYYETHGQGWSKAALGRILGSSALSKMKANEPRGREGMAYEFEEALEKLLPYLP